MIVINYYQLPGYTCGSRLIEVNLTLIIKNGENDSEAQIAPSSHYGFSVITQNFTSHLESNQTYSVTIQVLYGLTAIATRQHQFGEN